MLSSNDLAQIIIRKHYSLRSDLPDYKEQLNSNHAFFALRNLAFREFAGQTGLFRLRRKTFLNHPDIGDNFVFTNVKYSPSLGYALVFGSSPRRDASSCFVVNLNGDTAEITPLMSTRREPFEEDCIHAGDHYIVAVVTTSSRVIIWNTKGDVVYEFKLAHTGFLTIGSSRRYVVVRNENFDKSVTLSIYDASNRKSHTFGDASDFIVRSRPIRVDNWRPSIFIKEKQKQIITVCASGGHSAIICGQGFDTDEGKLVEELAEIIPVSDPFNSNGFLVESRCSVNGTMLRRQAWGSGFRSISYPLYEEKHNKDSLVTEIFERDVDLPQEGYKILQDSFYVPFCYRNAFYLITPMPRPKPSLFPSPDVYVLWRSERKGRKQAFHSLPGQGVPPLLFHHALEVGVTDKEFAFLCWKEILVYEWLDFDTFMKGASEVSQELHELSRML
ncbi:hypothetical protein ABW19_dt0204519 [Dactylella cylindrospora]|nr:hypothetical protein ABW19_dt0204519 [Dactylella cylindrospora]